MEKYLLGKECLLSSFCSYNFGEVCNSGGAVCIQRIQKQLYSVRERSMIHSKISSLQHGSLPKFLEYVETEDHHNFVLLPPCGKTVCEGILHAYPEGYTEKTVRQIILAIAKSLQFLHSHGICHGLLSPSNIYLSSNSGTISVMLLDYYLSTSLDQTSFRLAASKNSSFCAPEIIKFGLLSPSSDVWSLGVLAYVLLSGEDPFRKNYSFKKLSKKGMFSSSVWKNVSEGAKNLIRNMLSVKPERRSTIGSVLRSRWMQSAGDDKGLTKGISPLLRSFSIKWRRLDERGGKSLLPYSSKLLQDSHKLRISTSTSRKRYIVAGLSLTLFTVLATWGGIKYDESESNRCIVLYATLSGVLVSLIVLLSQSWNSIRKRLKILHISSEDQSLLGLRDAQFVQSKVLPSEHEKKGDDFGYTQSIVFDDSFNSRTCKRTTGDNANGLRFQSSQSTDVGIHSPHFLSEQSVASEEMMQEYWQRASSKSPDNGASYRRTAFRRPHPYRIWSPPAEDIPGLQLRIGYGMTEKAYHLLDELGIRGSIRKWISLCQKWFIWTLPEVEREILFINEAAWTSNPAMDFRRDIETRRFRLQGLLDGSFSPETMSRRVQELSESKLGEYRWDYSRKTLPPDSEILFRVFCWKIDTLLSYQTGHSEEPFSRRYVTGSRHHRQSTAKRGNGPFLEQVSESPPHFRVIVSDETWEVVYGPDNLFSAIVLLLFYVHKHRGGRFCGIDMDSEFGVFD